MWFYSGESFCAGPAAPPGDVFRVTEPTPVGGTPAVGEAHLRIQGPVALGADQGQLAVAGGRVWVTDSSPPQVISFPETVSLPAFVDTKPGWVTFEGVVQVAVLACGVLCIAVLLVRRRRRNRELTPR